MSFKSGFESRERGERASQFNTAGGSEFHVRGAAVLNNCLCSTFDTCPYCQMEPLCKRDAPGG